MIFIESHKGEERSDNFLKKVYINAKQGTFHVERFYTSVWAGPTFSA